MRESDFASVTFAKELKASTEIIGEWLGEKNSYSSRSFGNPIHDRHVKGKGRHAEDERSMVPRGGAAQRGSPTFSLRARAAQWHLATGATMR